MRYFRLGATAAVIAAAFIVCIAVGGCLPDRYADAEEAVRGVLVNPDRARSWQTADLARGVAVMMNGHAAFWVKDGRVFTVSESAGVLAPEGELPPHLITVHAVRQALKGRDLSISGSLGVSPRDIRERMNAYLERRGNLRVVLRGGADSVIERGGLEWGTVKISETALEAVSVRVAAGLSSEADMTPALHAVFAAMEAVSEEMTEEDRYRLKGEGADSAGGSSKESFSVERDGVIFEVSRSRPGFLVLNISAAVKR